jgi:hypothetical protein
MNRGIEDREWKKRGKKKVGIDEQIDPLLPSKSKPPSLLTGTNSLSLGFQFPLLLTMVHFTQTLEVF